MAVVAWLILLAGAGALIAWLLARARPAPGPSSGTSLGSPAPTSSSRSNDPISNPYTPHPKTTKRSPRGRDKEILDGRLELTGSGQFAIDVVGESHYQQALAAIVAKPRFAQKTCDAVLIMEDENPHDSNAVRVEINRQVVGYLPRKTAIVFRQAIAENGFGHVESVCRAQIRGGGDAYYGVWLDI